MEAADLLADRIAIIANGRIECYGSKMYLNRRYGEIPQIAHRLNYTRRNQFSSHQHIKKDLYNAN